MNSELRCLVKETSDEISYRNKFYPNAKSIDNEDLVCTICDETLSKKSITLHPVLGVLLCKDCFEKNKSTDKKKCFVCGGGKKLIECKSKKCSYFTCEIEVVNVKIFSSDSLVRLREFTTTRKACAEQSVSELLITECVTKVNPKAKSYFKQGKWNCFACHISPLFKLRGVAAMASDSIEKSSNQPNKRAINKAKDKSNKPEEEAPKTNGQLLARSDSSSSSGTEFTKSKIIGASLSSSRVNHHDLSDISDHESREDETLTNRQLLDFKHNVKKLFDGLKEMGTKLLKDVDKVQQNFYTNKNKFKPADVISMMDECKNIIQYVQESTNKQEKKLIDRHKTWCRKSKIKNTFIDNHVKPTKKQETKSRDKRVDLSSDEEGAKLTSTPIERVQTNNCQLEVSDCDEQVFSSGNEADKISNCVNQEETTINNVNDEDSFNVSKDLFSDCDEIEAPVERTPSSKSSKKSSDASDDDDDKRKKRFLKVKKAIEKVESDESSGPGEKVKPKRRLSRSKGNRKSNEDIEAREMKAKEQLLKSSSSDNIEKDRNDSDIVLTPESHSKVLSFDAETEKEDGRQNKGRNKSSDAELTEVEGRVPTKASRKQIDVSSNKKTDVNNDDSSGSDGEKGEGANSESEHERGDKKRKEEELAKKALLKSSSDSDNEDKSESDHEEGSEGEKRKKKTPSDSSAESDNEESKKDEEAKKAILDSMSDSDDEGDEKAKEAEKSVAVSSSESEDEESLLKKKEEETKNSILLSSESDGKVDEKKTSDSDDETISSINSSSRSKSKKLQLENNVHYKKDKKLKLKCTVEVDRLGDKVLAEHSKALRLSAEYLENRKIKSLISLDGLEKKKKKKARSDSSADESTHSRSRKKTKIADGDTLLDHLKKVEIGNGNNDSNNSGSEDGASGNKVGKETEPSLEQEADKLAKASILANSDSSDVEELPMDTNDSRNVENDDKSKKDKCKKKNDSEDKENDNDNEDDEDDNKKKKDDSWKRSILLTSKILDSDSDEENAKAQKRLSHRSKNDSDSNKEGDDSFQVKKKVVRTRRRRLDSDSDVKISNDSSSDSDDDGDDKKNKDSTNKKESGKNLKRRKKSESSDSSSSLLSKKSKTKRRRIRAVADDSDDSSDEDLPNSQSGANKSGRKNIRKVLKDKHVADGTLQAAKQEEERIRRMAERQKLYNEMYEARLANEAKVDKLVLDFDAETKQVLLEVDENLVKRLKPHQAKGIKFMWDACFESLERIKESEGSGCILAHCMGLGKSFQVVTLAHTLLIHSEKTGINKILIVVPLSTVLNWMNEFKIWLSEVENGSDIELYEMTKAKTNLERKCHLENWQRTGGVLVIGYEMFRNLCAIKGKVRKSVQEAILKCILDPGPDLIICDEGHLLKNEDSAISKAIRRVKTLRRIVLTGTPLQNNLLEYHCMVQFVKPNLLGSKKEFSNRFVNPIQNGQFDDSTEYDVKLMKKRAHVLHKMLEGSVQRFDYSVLTPFLPPKQEYVISIRLSPVQVKLYQYYIDNFARKHKGVGGSLFADFQALSRLWTHPFVVKLHTENSERIQQKKRDAESDSEGSLKDFIDDGSESETSTSESSSNNTSNESDVVALDDEDGKKSKKSKPPPPKRGTRANPVVEDVPEPEEPTVENREWWTEFIKDEDFDDMRLSAKLMILFDIIKEAEAIGDKVLVFSQSLYSLTLIEKFLGMVDDETQNGNQLETLGNHTGCWVIGQDYFRFDGQTSAENRSHWVKSFNKPSNTRARLFLISTRAGGLGINLTAANRVVIFDASWNPSHDVQSIFRIYRFGQKKPCYVYRLLAAGTMEEKIYNRQVTKLSLSCRVVDELQIERHYSNNDLAELYRFDPPSSETPDLALPKDRLLAEIFLRHKNYVETYHEHDSLLENIAEEELDAEERKQAWQEYEDEKAGKRLMPPQMMMNYPSHQHMLMMQQYNNQMANTLNLNNPINQVELSQLMSMFQQDYPHLTEQAQRNMAVKALSNMYNYVENQVVGRGFNPTVMNNPGNVSNPTSLLANALAQQEYTRVHSAGYNQQNLTQQQRQMMYSQSYGNSFGKTQQKTPANPAAAASASKQFVNDDSDDIIEIPSSSSTRVNQPSNSPKRQEE